ncbi:hypothetical protein [Kutzneria chonburiensis]|uniref:Uncharacterized protein n=1 Tax=Kutzneria chonburiensis TaxID=1483604 RepID=A0ABV6N2X3_9PSEU|nr:hypothetical protein [Kutzneria chonburiensis]
MAILKAGERAGRLPEVLAGRGGALGWSGPAERETALVAGTG